MELHFFDAGVDKARGRLRLDFHLKPKQREAVWHVYNGLDVFIWLPTGYGKSLCFQILPFLIDWKKSEGGKTSPCCNVVLVVSPLLSLMHEQVAQLRSKGVAATATTLPGAESELSTCSLLYTSPEAILGDKWLNIFSSSSFSNSLVAIAIDEVHCVSKW